MTTTAAVRDLARALWPATAAEVDAATPTLTLLCNWGGGWDWTRERGQSVTVTFEGPDAEAHALAFLDRNSYPTRRALDFVWDLPVNEDSDPAAVDAFFDAFPQLVARRFPTCEHGADAGLCMGPAHYPTAEQERHLWGGA